MQNACVCFDDKSRTSFSEYIRTKRYFKSVTISWKKILPYFNNKYGQSGTLWKGRFKASSIDSERYLLACYRYIELNPVRAGMITKPEEYSWSSYRMNAYGEKNPLVTPDEKHLSLGNNKKKRLDRPHLLHCSNAPKSLLYRCFA